MQFERRVPVGGSRTEIKLDARRIVARLLERYPQPGLALEFSNPLELLVAVILSAQCTDARVNEVTRALILWLLHK